MEKADLFAVLAGFVPDTETGWSLGTFGAIAEFTRDPGEPAALVSRRDCLSAVTGRGGIRLEPAPDLRLVASESATRSGWNQKVALCLPLEGSRMSGRRVLTELGPDEAPLREEDRSGVLFDLGLGVDHLDALIRVTPEHAGRLRPHCGRGLFDPDNLAMHDIFAAQPHRVFLARCGRIEVFSPIPPPDGRSPEGPHTHLLPKLLTRHRTHPATEPIPEGWVPVAHFYPPHPLPSGARTFDRDRHEAFQQLLRVFGSPKFVAAKHAARRALAAGEAPPPGDSREARSAVRIAFAQAEACDGPIAAFSDWRQTLDQDFVNDPLATDPDV